MANNQSWPQFIYPIKGDVDSEVGNQTVTVTGIQNTPFSSTTPTSGQVPVLTSGVWTPTTLNSGGFPVGASIFPQIPFIGTAASVTDSAVKSLVYGINAGSVAAFTGHFQLNFQVGSGPFTLSKAIIERTLPNDSTIIDSTNVTWGGVSNPTLATGNNLSDSIAYIADADHDYYIILVTSGSSGGTVYSPAASSAILMHGGADNGDSSAHTVSQLQTTIGDNFWFAITGIYTA